MKKYIAIMMVLLLVFVIGMRKADAIPTMTVFDVGTATTVTIADGGLLDSLSLVPGQVLYVGSVGVWTLTVDTGLTKPYIGSATNPQFDLNVVASSSGAGSLTVSWSDIDFSPGVPFNATVNTGGTTAGTVSVTGYADTGNGLFGTGTTLSSLGPFGVGAFAGSGSGSVVAVPFSLTLVSAITHTDVGRSTLNSEIVPVPEPTTLFLMGAGLLGLGILARKRVKTVGNC